MLTDLLAHQFADDPNTPDEVEDEGFDLEAMLAEVNAKAAPQSADDNDADSVNDWEPV